VKYAKQRRAFGKTIGEFQAIQWMLADMQTELEAARGLVYYAAWLKDSGRNLGTAASKAKLFASEIVNQAEVVASAILKAPAKSEAMAYAWAVCQSKQPENLVWGETGPRLVAEAVKKFSLEAYRQPADVFCPLGYADWRKVIEPDALLRFNESTRAIHLWNEMWRDSGQDKNAAYDPGCLYEQLKQRYLGEQSAVGSRQDTRGLSVRPA